MVNTPGATLLNILNKTCSPPAAIDLPVMGRHSWALLPSMLQCWLAWFSSCLVQALTVFVSSWVRWSCYVQKILFWSGPPTSDCYSLFIPSSVMVLDPWWEESDSYMPFMAGHWHTQLHFNQLWVSTLIIHGTELKKAEVCSPVGVKTQT